MTQEGLVQDVLGIAGLLLIVAGIAMWSVPAALVTGGCCSLTIATVWARRSKRPGGSS